MPDLSGQLLERSLNTASDPATLFAITQRALADLGCDDVTFAAGMRLGWQIRPYFTTLSPEILRATFGDQDASIYVRRFLQHGDDSFFSDPSIYKDASPAEGDHLKLLQQAGYRRGYFAGLNRNSYRYIAICCHLDALSDSELDRHQVEICARLLEIGKLTLKVFLSKHINSQYGLSLRERDVLSYLAHGLRPDQIAHRLGVGARTVDKFIVKAKKKLSARTRDHAVARALLLGLLDF